MLDKSISVLYYLLLPFVMVREGLQICFYFILFLVFPSSSGCQGEFLSSGNVGEVGKMSKRGCKAHFKGSC